MRSRAFRPIKDPRSSWHLATPGFDGATMMEGDCGQPLTCGGVWSFVDEVRQVDEVAHLARAQERRTPDRTEVVSALFFAHHRRLVGLASLLAPDQQTAEDVVQEAFAGLYRRWRQLRDPNAAVAYLNRAVVNGSRDSLRRKRRAGTAMLLIVPKSGQLESAEHEAVHHQEGDQLWAAVTALPMRQRQVLVLRYYLDQSEAEIAETLEISRGSVKTHASRGIAAIARDWEGRS
jgi:RNA polymerase sigma-70 factor (sigma-E family)